MPTDTTSRFILLIVAVLSASVFAYTFSSPALPSTVARFERAQECARAAEAMALPADVRPIDRQRLVAQARYHCQRPYRLWVALVVLGGLLFLSLVALGLYMLTPTWKMRRRRLVALEKDDAPELVASFQELCRQAGVARVPTLLWNPLAPRGGALAFGRFRRCYVAVGAGLVVQYYTDREATLAVLRHELAHVVNRDVSKTYLALSVWYAFVVAGLLPLLLLELTEGSVLTFGLVWRMAALAIFVYAARNSVLRAREYYADAWAGSSDDERTALAGILERVPREDTKPLERLWRVHPGPDGRLRALRDSAELFRPRLWDSAAAGVLAGFAFPTFRQFLFLVVPLEYTLYIGASAALASASLIGVVLGTSVWRASLAARAEDAPAPAVEPLALAAAVGFAIGSGISLGGGDMSTGSTVVLVVFMLVSVYWLVGTADAWFDAAASTRSGTLFSWAGLIAAALVVWSTGWVSVFGTGRRAAEDFSIPEWANWLALHWLTPVMIGSLVLFPAVASLLARRVRSSFAPGWVIAEAGQGVSQPWPQRQPLAVAPALRSGAAGGVVFCLIILALRALDVSARVLTKPFEEVAIDYAPGLDSARIFLAVMCQAAVAAFVGLRARRAPVIHALLAVPPCAMLMTLGVILPYLIDGDGLPGNLWPIAKLVLAGGAVAALVIGGGIEALRRALPRARAPLLAFGTAALVVSVLSACGSDSKAPPSRAQRLTPAEAHRMVVQQLAGDPAVTDLPFETFDTIARTLCDGIDAGEWSAKSMALEITQQPTSSGAPMKLESAAAIVSASVRAYCPQHESQLRELDATSTVP